MKRIAALLIAAVAGAWLATGMAQAKGPVEVTVSGGDLPAPAKLEGTVPVQALFPEPPHYIDEPVPYPENIYTLTFGEGGEEYFSLSYYPAHDGIEAAVRDGKGNFSSVPPELADVLAGAQLVATTESGDDGASLLWLAAPALLGVVVVGGGVAGVVRRRRA